MGTTPRVACTTTTSVHQRARRLLADKRTDERHTWPATREDSTMGVGLSPPFLGRGSISRRSLVVWQLTPSLCPTPRSTRLLLLLLLGWRTVIVVVPVAKLLRHNLNDESLFSHFLFFSCLFNNDDDMMISWAWNASNLFRLCHVILFPHLLLTRSRVTAPRPLDALCRAVPLQKHSECKVNHRTHSHKDDADDDDERLCCVCVNLTGIPSLLLEDDLS